MKNKGPMKYFTCLFCCPDGTRRRGFLKGTKEKNRGFGYADWQGQGMVLETVARQEITKEEYEAKVADYPVDLKDVPVE